MFSTFLGTSSPRQDWICCYIVSLLALKESSGAGTRAELRSFEVITERNETARNETIRNEPAVSRISEMLLQWNGSRGHHGRNITEHLRLNQLISQMGGPEMFYIKF